MVHASESIVLEALGGHHFGIETTTEIEDGAAGSVEVETPLLVLAKAGSIGATSTGAGRAGPVTVRADRVHISGGSEIASDARGTGDAGPVRLRVADRLVVDGVEDERPSGVFSRTFGPARGASVAIDARRVELRNGGTIAASSTGTGDAGDVTVAVTDDLLAHAGVISTSAPLANGGNITLRAGDRIELHGSRVAADVGSGRGGNVLLAPTTLLLLDGSAITAQAGSGQGGAIRIVADAVVQALDATVSASAGAAGIDGTVTFETPGLDYTAPLQALPAEFVDAVTLLHARCAERHGARASFVVDLAAEPKPGPERLLPVAIRDPGDDPESGPVVLVLEPAGEEGAWRARCDG